ncbi:MAG: hypothetical protein RL761_677 [Pseudomonadota bacterium]
MIVSVQGLRSQYVEALTSGSYALLLVMALLNLGKSNSVVYLAVLAVIGFVSWLATLKRAQAIAELPTSRIASAAQGYVELYGQASIDDDNLIISPHSGLSCLWYRYRIYEKNDNDWREIHDVTSYATFEIRDSTGICRIDPDDAEILGADIRTTYQDGDKHVEEMLFSGGRIYVLGEFSTLSASPMAASFSEDVGALLAEWKKDPQQLKKRFDLNGDGEIDLQEWELARRLAQRTVEKEHASLHQTSNVNMMRAPKSGRLFLISNLSPHKLRRRFIFWSYIHLAVFFVAVSATIFSMQK